MTGRSQSAVPILLAQALVLFFVVEPPSHPVDSHDKS